MARSKLQKIRKAQGLTVQELATLTEISFRTLSHYDQGDRIASVVPLLKIASVLHCKLSDLLEGEAGEIADYWERSILALDK